MSGTYYSPISLNFNSINFYGDNNGGSNTAVINSPTGNFSNSSLLGNANNNGYNFEFNNALPHQQNSRYTPHPSQKNHGRPSFFHHRNRFPHAMKGFKFFGDHAKNKFKQHAPSQTEKQCKAPISKPPVSGKEKCKPVTTPPEKKCKPFTPDYGKSPASNSKKCHKPVNFPAKNHDYRPPQPEKNCKFTPPAPPKDYSQPVPSAPTNRYDSNSGNILNNIFGNGNTVNNITVNNNYYTLNFPQSA